MHLVAHEEVFEWYENKKNPAVCFSGICRWNRLLVVCSDFRDLVNPNYCFSSFTERGGCRPPRTYWPELLSSHNIVIYIWNTYVLFISNLYLNIIYHVDVPLQAALLLKALLILLYLPLFGLKTFHNNFIWFNNISIHFEFFNINANTNLLMSIICFMYYYSWITYHKKM